jgi:hypothetical protein
VIASLEDLLERHAWAALRISGADQSAWSGEIVEAGEGILGLAHWDGTLHLDREYILDPLRDLYDRADGPRTEAELLRCREALVTLLHEQSHFLGPAGATQEAARAAFKLPGSRVLEEGVAEAWAHDHLNDYIRELGIDKVAPGILHVRSEPSYAAFVPGVRLFAADLDRLSGAPAGETLDLLNRQTAEGQWHQAVTRIYHSTRLPHLVPPDQVPAVRLHLEQALRSSFKGLELYEPLPRGFAASRSHAATTRTLTFLHQELATAERHYTPTTRPTRIHLTPPTSSLPPSRTTPPNSSIPPSRSTPATLPTPPSHSAPATLPIPPSRSNPATLPTPPSHSTPATLPIPASRSTPATLSIPPGGSIASAPPASPSMSIPAAPIGDPAAPSGNSAAPAGDPAALSDDSAAPAGDSSVPGGTSAPSQRLAPADSNQAALHAFAGVSPPTAHPPVQPGATAEVATKATASVGTATTVRDLER